MSSAMHPALLERDPVLAAAMRAHGADWRPDLLARTQLQRDDKRRLPGIDLSMLEHKLEWPQGASAAVLHLTWEQGNRIKRVGWIARFHLAPLPETISLAITGRTLDAVIGAEGADAWRVDEVDTVPGVRSTLKLSRATRTN